VLPLKRRRAEVAIQFGQLLPSAGKQREKTDHAVSAASAFGTGLERAVLLPTNKRPNKWPNKWHRTRPAAAFGNHSGRYIMETVFIAIGIGVLVCVAIWLFVFEPRRKIYDA
jgi:hypothetical protein